MSPRRKRDDDMCQRCHCCSVMPEMVPCWMCGGFCGDWADDDDDDGWCDECKGEGEIVVYYCSCDENGKHKPKPVVVSGEMLMRLREGEGNDA